MMMRRMPCAFLEGFLHLSLYRLHVCEAFQYYALKPLKAICGVRLLTLDLKKGTPDLARWYHDPSLCV